MHIRRRVLFGRTPGISEKLWGDRTKNKAAPMALQALNSLTLQVAKEHPRLQNYFAFLKTVYFLGLQTVPCVGKNTVFPISE